ncbi:Transposon Tf2-8 polyprotein [Colletotrichum fructicola Nara gc5]|uniref:RNA-directed DNA polymerase n=1 Tax=Colletotrichum fructicola (strain Nara gc5) TaxID=1213859 RepID=A0A7J6IJK4_COLFN|nr:Transposon Tf2-8 polyprotein [Colletotrichum fructicola Nara gc5]KAF4479117.1 Transposon Tf2-8 polyprotein [Colletotrichum fructicola Nara gc5]KAF4490828.1 Transposon Tf2-8 polyprotein [Colletotrichum fructicola Nara gc5]
MATNEGISPTPVNVLKTQSSKPRHSLPHPPMFNGLKSQWRGWKLEMEGKIEEDADAIGNMKSQLRYIYTRLEGSAKTNITTFYELELGKEYPRPQALIRRLDLLYGERNRKDKAIQALHTIRQKDTESFTTFYPRFEKEIANAEAEGWEDSAKISYLRNALHPKLKAHLIGCSQSQLDLYEAFATKCEEISNQMELFGEWTYEKKTNAPQKPTWPRSQPNAAPTRDMMEWEPTNTVQVRTFNPKRNITGYPSQRPEDQSLLGKRAKALYDDGCHCYMSISLKLARKLRLPTIDITPRDLLQVSHVQKRAITQVAYFDIDIDGHKQQRVFAYVIPDQTEDVILGIPWARQQDVQVRPRYNELYVGTTGTYITIRHSPTWDSDPTIRSVAASTLTTIIRSSRRSHKPIQIFSVTMKDIEKALARFQKKSTDPATKLPAHYRHMIDLFKKEVADRLPPHRPGVDHAIQLEKDDHGNEKQPPWGPIYSMSKEELLVLRKTLTDLLDKGFIRASNSPAAAPILFVRKPGGGLRFCVDYHTLRQLSKAKWFTKLDVSSAFWKIRMREGDEWKTAFRTSDLPELQEAGLQLDVDKCEFEQKRVKYLGYIVDVDSGISVDPDKIEAIEHWETPTTIRGVRGFLGFANYYRDFIPDFSTTAAPLTYLTKKDVPYHWTDNCQQAFEKLKTALIMAPVLAKFDPERPTRVQPDSSGYAMGGELSQLNETNEWHPVAYHSRRYTSAESNYLIHDKELLAVVECLKQWSGMLRSVGEFTVLSDHKNLEYFMKKQQLSERQVRWALELSRYNFRIVHRPGKEAVVPDALSRRDQDLPKDADDERLRARYQQLLEVAEDGSVQIPRTITSLQPQTQISSGWVSGGDKDYTTDENADMSEPPESPFMDEELRNLWDQALQNNNRTIFEPMKEITTEAVAKAMRDCFIRHHGFPRAIVSDRDGFQLPTTLRPTEPQNG